MPIIIHFFILLFGFLILWCSSTKAIEYSSQTAQLFGVSKLFIGFVLLAVSTGLPELLVAIQSVIAGKPTLSSGDIIGSNFVDISVSLGLAAALCGPIYVELIDYHRQMIMLGLSCALMAFIFIAGELTRNIGLVLLLIYAAGIFWLWKQRRVRYDVEEEEIVLAHVAHLTRTGTIIRLIINLILVIASSKICVDSALYLAQYFSLPLDILGVSIFALGTSLPEISLNIQAVRKKNYSLAIGNSLGSVFEQGSLILGLLAVISPQAISLKHLYSMIPFLFFSYGLVAYALIIKKMVSKLIGYFLVGSFVLFIILQVMLWVNGQ